MYVWWYPALFVPIGICYDCTSMNNPAMFLLVNHFVSRTNMHAEENASDVLSWSPDVISFGTHVLVVLSQVMVSRADFIPAVPIFVRFGCTFSTCPRLTMIIKENHMFGFRWLGEHKIHQGCLRSKLFWQKEDVELQENMCWNLLNCFNFCINEFSNRLWTSSQSQA